MNYLIKSKLIILSKTFKYLKYRNNHHSGFCKVCGRKSIFLYDNENIKESMHCIKCNAWLRLRYLTEQIIDEYSDTGAKSLTELVNEPKFNSLNILEAQSEGPINNILRKCTNYTCSEYFENVPSGNIYNGKRCEDLQNLSFQDNTLDLILHTSVMEHVRKPNQAFNEQYRVLKPNGILLFEIPMTDINKHGIREKSVSRIDTSSKQDKFILEPIYHGDPLRKNGALVYTDWGMDIVEILEKIGFKVHIKSIQLDNSIMSHIVVLKCIK